MGTALAPTLSGYPSHSLPRFIEDFEIGSVIVTPGRTVTETDVQNFAGMSGDFNQMHTDAEFASRSQFGQRIAHGALGFAIATGLSARIGYFDGTAVAFLGTENWDFKGPIFIGDTVRLRAEVLSTRLTSSRDKGILVRKMELVNQRGEVVQSGTFKVMVRSKAAGLNSRQ